MPDTCWADPLSRAERRELARKLARACTRFYATRDATGLTGFLNADTAITISRTMASAEMSELHLDVTERAAVTP